MGLFVLGIVLGLVIGAGLMYWTMQQKIDQQRRNVRQNSRSMEELARSHDLRVEETVNTLRQDYQHKLDQQTQQLTAQHQAEMQRLQADYQQQLDAMQQRTEMAIAQSTVQPLPIEGSGAPSPDLTSTLLTSQTHLVEPSSPAIAERPTSELSDLLIKLGNAGNPGHIPLLVKYTSDPNSQIRSQVATSIGQIMAFKVVRSEGDAALSALNRLSRDPHPSVRLAAVEALGKIKSTKVIPMLKLALRDSHTEVVKSASLAISQFKFYPNQQGFSTLKSAPKKSNR